MAILLFLDLGLGGIGARVKTVDAASAGPQLLSYTPASATTNVPLNSNLMLTFDESVKKVSGSAAISIRRLVDNELFESYQVYTDSRVSINAASRNVVTVTPSKNFELNTSYYVVIDAGAFVNESNDKPYSGLSNAAAWNFTTITQKDTNAPRLLSLNPAHGAGGVAIGSPLVMTFDKPVYAASGYITLRNMTSGNSGDVQSIPVTSTSVKGSGTTAVTIQPPELLKDNSSYEVTVPAGSFQDASGNSFTGIYGGEVWKFTTGAPPLGSPVKQPANNAVNVATNSTLTLTFPVNITPGSGNIVLKKISDNSTVETIPVSSYRVTISGNRTVTIAPSSSLPASTELYVLIDQGAFRSAANSSVVYEGITNAGEWSFTTNLGNDTTRPYITERTPANGAVQSATSFDLEMKFNKPVYPGSGEIVIKTLSGDATVATIPVTSDKVSGGGTNKITVKPGVTLKSNATYYVQISAQAFRDANSNYFLGITGSDTSSWRFTISEDSLKPTILFTTPFNGGTEVPLKNAVLYATFSKPIQLGSGSVTLKKLKSTTAGAIATDVSIDPQNNQRLMIKVPATLDSNTEYYVEITPGLVKDFAGNSFDGILNQYQWTFKTTNTAGGAPTVVKTEMIGTSLMSITFNKALNPDSVPAPANFYVTVNGASRAISSVEINGSSVLLKLQVAVASGQTVSVSYSPGTSPVEDMNGKAAAGFASRDVVNNPDTTMPKIMSGTINGSLITLIANKTLAQLPADAYKQFTVYVDGYSRAVTQAVVTDGMILLSLSSPVTSSQSVSVSYYPSTYVTIRDLAGNELASFSSMYLTNGPDTQAPVLQSASVSGSTITLTFNKVLNGSQVPAASSFSVLVNSRSRSVSSVSISGAQVYVNLISAVSSGDSVVISYTGGSKPIVDYAGNAAATFSSRQVSGTSTSTYLVGAEVRSATITLTFSSSLNSSYVPSSSQFAVKVNGVSRAVSSVSVNGYYVTLTLTTPIASGDTVKISYSGTGTGLRSTSGDVASSFTDFSVANQTSWTDNNANGDFETAAGGGLNIKIAAATTSSDTSPAGRTTRRYTLSSVKVAAAYQAVTSTSGMTPRVVFTVPDSELAAIVAISLEALQEAKKKTPAGSIAIAYRETSFEIPFSAIDFQQAAQTANISLTGGYLLLQIDTAASAISSQLTAAINSSRSQQLVSSINFAAAITSAGGIAKPFESFSGYVNHSMSTGSAIEPRTTATVWFDSEAGKLNYAPTKVVTQNGKSVVTFQSKNNGTFAAVKGQAEFKDIAKHWASNDILVLANKYIVEGKSATAFEPKTPITRGEFAMYIVRGLGLAGDRQSAAKYKDVSSSSALAPYIGAATRAGIVKGMTDGTFKPDNPITREEITAMMVRAAEAAGAPISAVKDVTDVLKKFKDYKTIGNWAQADVAKAVQAGIINGMSNGGFGAKAQTSRAEAAIMIRRLLDYAGFIDS